jgi:serine/threonine protein kinase
MIVEEKEEERKLENQTKQKLKIQLKKNLKLKPIAILDKDYYLIKKLGKGSTSTVYLGFSPRDPSHKLYSFKIIKKNSEINENLFFKEVSILSQLNHKNILQIYKSGESEIKKSNKKEKKVYYIIEEYMKYGEILEYIYLTKGFGEHYGRIIFLSLLNAIEYLHDNNIVHRDIKADNIMINSDLEIKLVDFGFANNLNIGKLNTFLGTPNYAAPELHLKIPYYGKSNDIFSLGVTLFIIVTGTLPFKLPLPNDPLYQYIYKNDYIAFWIKRKLNLSQSFMELFESSVAFDYSQRPTISEIRNCQWMKEINLNLIDSLKDDNKKRFCFIKNKEKKCNGIIKEGNVYK